MSRAISLVGLQPLAKAIGVSYQAIRKYERGTLSAERVIPVARATGWQITPHELRPDLYPYLADGLPLQQLVRQPAATLDERSQMVARLGDVGLHAGRGQAAGEHGVELAHELGGGVGGRDGDGVEQQQERDLHGAGSVAEQRGAQREGCLLGHGQDPAVVDGAILAADAGQSFIRSNRAVMHCTRDAAATHPEHAA